jgi:hypothetical protein
MAGYPRNSLRKALSSIMVSRPVRGPSHLSRVRFSASHGVTPVELWLPSGPLVPNTVTELSRVRLFWSGSSGWFKMMVLKSRWPISRVARSAQNRYPTLVRGFSPRLSATPSKYSTFATKKCWFGAIFRPEAPKELTDLLPLCTTVYLFFSVPEVQLTTGPVM